MNENIVKLLKKIEENPELGKALSECKDPEQAFRLLDGEQSGITIEEFKEAMTSFNTETELTDDDLNHVAGGLTEEEKIIAGSVSIGVGVIATAASAAI